MFLGGLLLGRLLSLTTQQHVDLLLDPVLVVRLIRLCVRSIPETDKTTSRFSCNACSSFLETAATMSKTAVTTETPTLFHPVLPVSHQLITMRY